MAFKYHIPSIYARALLVVAAPADETIWAGGTVLMNPGCRWTVLSVFKTESANRENGFAQATEALDVKGIDLKLDYLSGNTLITEREIEKAVINALTMDRYDIIITHSVYGEFTGNILQAKTGKAILSARKAGQLHSDTLFMFAYEDNKGQHLPKPVKDSDKIVRLPDQVWAEKQRILTDIYGLNPESKEFKAASKLESYWQFK